MYRQIRKLRIKPGKAPKVLALAKEVEAYLGEKYDEFDMKVGLQLFGPVGTLYYCIDFDSLAIAEQSLAKLNADADWADFLARSVEFFIEGTNETALLQIV